MTLPSLPRNNYIRDFLSKDKHLPHWLILLADMLIIYFAFSFSYVLVNLANIELVEFSQYLLYTATLCTIALPVVYFSKLHTGLLRYSNVRDLFKIFFTTAIFSMIFLAVMFSFGKGIIAGEGTKLYLNVIINFFVTACLLLVFRISAKSIFFALSRNFSDKKIHRVLVFGSDKNAVLLKNALENNKQELYRVCGFIDEDTARVNSYLEEKKVFHISSLGALVRNKRIKELVVVQDTLEKDNKKRLIEEAVQLGIRVLTVPPVNKWLSGNLGQKQIQKLKIEDLLQREPIKIDSTSVKNDIRNKRVLITGAAGSIGSEIVRQVLTYEPKLLILCDNAESPLHAMQLEIEENYPGARVELFISDVRDHDRMQHLFNKTKPQIVYHAAAYKHVPLMENNPFEAVKVNVGGTKNVADLSVRFAVEKFVMVSTDKAVNPTNIMGASKRLAEIYTQSLNEYLNSETRFITTRFGNVLGSNGSVIPRFREQIEKGGPITVTHPDITRYFMTIPEAVQLVLEAGTMGKGGEIFVFDMGEPVKIVDMARKMIQLAGLQEGRDIDITFTGLRPGEKLYEELLATSELTVPTHHEKISIAKVRTYPFESVSASIEGLLKINKTQDQERIVKKMKEIVPEFKSKNSVYEKLDTVQQTEYRDMETMS